MNLQKLYKNQFSNKKITIMALLLSILLLGMANKTAFAASEELTLVQKQSYYEQYETIIEEAKVKYPEAALSLKPFEDFKTEEWVEAAEFAEIVEDMVNAEFVIDMGNNEFVADQPKLGIMPLSSHGTVIPTKNVTTKINGSDVTIWVTGSFNTTLSGGVQKFDGTINSVVSSSNKGHWTQTGYSPTLKNSNKTWSIEVTGKWEYGGAQQGVKNVTIPFTISSTGVVS